MAEIQNIIELTFTEADGSAFAASALESANNAAESATNAFRYASTASNNAEEALQSEVNARNYAQASADSAGNTQTLASQAAESAENASNYASNSLSYSLNAEASAQDARSYSAVAQSASQNAERHKNSASNYADSASNSASSAGLDATDARNSAMSASASAASANTAKNNAEASATAAASSASTAQTQAQNAMTHASNAQTFANNAQTSATQAAASATTANDSANLAVEVAESIPEDYTTLSNDVDDLKSAIDDVTYSHTVSSANINDGVYEYGRFAASGAEYDSDVPITTAFRTKDYLPVIGGKTIEWYGNNIAQSRPLQFVQYDASKNIIVQRTDLYIRNVTDGAARKQIVLDNNTAYVRFDGYWEELDLDAVEISVYYSEDAKNEYEAYFEPYTESTTKYENIYDLTGKNIKDIINYAEFSDKKIAYDGDSICYGAGYAGGYPQIIGEMTNSDYVNNAVGGAHLASYADRHVVCESVNLLPLDADLVCFEGGINDFWGNCPIGTMSNSFTDTLDTSTICGAVESIFRQALTKWTGVPICFIITHKIYGTVNSQNAIGLTFKDYHDAIVSVCEKYSIPYLDLFYESGMNCEIEVNATRYTKEDASFSWGHDGCHPNEIGYRSYYVPKIIEFFRGLLI